MFWYNFDTVLCQFLETGTSDSQVSVHTPFHYFFTVLIHNGSLLDFYLINIVEDIVIFQGLNGIHSDNSYILSSQ